MSVVAGAGTYIESPHVIHSGSKIVGRRTAIAAYLLALLLGLSMAHYLLPLKAVLARDIRVRPVYQYDAAMNVYGQRYFTKEPWHWPLLLVRKLGSPEGTNVGFMDGIPLAEIVVKIFRRFLPPDFHSVYLWLALCWVLQPIAAVFALRSAGERRLLPNLAVAVIAVSMPTLLFRFVHSALCSHFLILIALGLYFQMVRSAKLGAILWADGLMLVALLVNPYIMEMVLAVLVAAPLTLLLRRERSWIRVAVGTGAGVAITAIAALLLGYGHAVPMGGFGTYSMNLLSPIYPTLAFWGGFVDVTGGQYEGYQYLGAGVILLLLAADFSLDMRGRLDLLRRHAGLLIACIGLTLLALSTKIYAGNRLLLDLPAPDWLQQLRSSGRLFWPVAYAAVLAGIVIVCRRLSARWAFTLVLVFAGLQYVESMPMRREVRSLIRNRPGYTINTVLFRSLLADHSMLYVWPKFGCGADITAPEYSQLYLLASEVAIPVNMTYVGRFTQWPNCNLPDFPISVGSSDLWVFVPQWRPAMVLSVDDWRDICRQSGPLVACAQDLRGRTDLPPPHLPTLPLDETVSATTGGSGLPWLASGWYEPESWGIWSHGRDAYLAPYFNRPFDRGLMLTVTAVGLAPHPSTAQKVTVVANGRTVATWDVAEGAAREYSAVLPPVSSAQSVYIEFHIDHPAVPGKQASGVDPRELGFGLTAFRFDALSTGKNAHSPRNDKGRQ